MSAPVSQDQIASAAAATEANLAAQGLPTHDEVKPAIYWGFNHKDRFVFPDGDQFIEFRRMNEGMRVDYQKRTNRKVKVGRVTGDAEMSVDPAGDRKALIQISCTGWKMYRLDHSGKVVEAAFNDRNLADWLSEADPVHIEALEKKIRECNPWMRNEMTVEAIDAEMANLAELRVEAEARERGEATS